MNRHDALLIFGIIAFIFLIIWKGMEWALEYMLSFFVAITIFNWIKEKVYRNEQL